MENFVNSFKVVQKEGFFKKIKKAANKIANDPIGTTKSFTNDVFNSKKKKKKEKKEEKYNNNQGF